ncbi:VOC family protein [Ammoniphilus sp. CFH 90114]|uniref:VOC family protein n=1 Tax=Ammoniphilus sp. CFH 90114 TaxID=2493665 RepID=UPI00100E841F|nr:VOC family protein [Ammoniphilus sp. CFH 90114]RXT05808.1 VOC family protein [Ammoniphilus sp. CFH 90114]
MMIKLEHVALIVKDMDASINYYCQMFGYELRTRGENQVREMAFLFHKNQPGVELELIRDLDPTKHNYSEKGIVNHLAFTVENMEEAISHYQDKGIQFLTDQPNTAIDGAKTIFFYGPNQELLQFVQPSKK